LIFASSAFSVLLQKHDPDLSEDQINTLIFEAIKAL
jgi:hypothetical protein